MAVNSEFLIFTSAEYPTSKSTPRKVLFLRYNFGTKILAKKSIVGRQFLLEKKGLFDFDLEKMQFYTNVH
jgi:hypothetical protein